MKKISSIAAAAILLMAGAAQAANYCGDLANAFGPMDYRTRAEHAENFHLVEMAHFTPEVEAGVKGNTGEIGADLDYTLRAIPNHHRALAAMARVAVTKKTVQVSGAKYPVECYFERGMRFQPNDGGVRNEYANYLYALGKEDQAFAMYRDAAAMTPDSATINYNLALAYYKRKDFAKSVEFAKKAYALGFPLPSLKNKLVEAGKWDGKVELKAPPPADSAAAPAPDNRPETMAEVKVLPRVEAKADPKPADAKP